MKLRAIAWASAFALGFIGSVNAAGPWLSPPARWDRAVLFPPRSTPTPSRATAPARFRPLQNGVHALARPKSICIPLTRATAGGGWLNPERTPWPENRRLGERSNDAPS